MKTKLSVLLITLIIVSAGLITYAFPIEEPLKTEIAKETDVKGAFTLILYGARHINDIETFAILDREGDRYTFEPYAPEFDYRVKKGLSAKDALHDADTFVSWHPAFLRAQLSRILDKKGETMGYEMRPLFMPLHFGLTDVLDVYYWLKDGSVRVYIKLKPSVESQLFQSGDGSKGAGGGN